MPQQRDLNRTREWAMAVADLIVARMFLDGPAKARRHAPSHSAAGTVAGIKDHNFTIVGD
jgi:hypothetical protein